MPDNKEEKPAEKKEEKPKQPTALESAVNESWNAAKASTNSLVGTAAIGGATTLFGLDGLVTSLAFPFGGMVESKLAGKPFTSKNFRDEAIAGALFTPPLWYSVKTIQNLPKAYGLDGIVNVLGASIPTSAFAIGGLTLAAIPLLNAFYYPIKYLIDNKKFEGIGKDFKENYWKGTKRSLIYLGLPTAAAVAASSTVPFLAPYLFPILAGLEVAYRIALSKEKLNWKLLNPFTYVPNYLNPFHVIPGAVSATYKVGNGVVEAVSAIGSTLYEKISKFFKAATAPSPTPQPKPA